MLNENFIVQLVKREVITDTFRKLPADKKERIYRVSIELFGRYGYDGLSVDQLCQAVSISKGSFFQYFPSKSHLLEFDVLIFDDFLSDLIDEVRQNETAVLARDRILHLYRALVLSSRLSKPEQSFFLFITRAMEHAGVILEGIDLERHFNDYISEIIERGSATGEIRRDAEVELTSYLVSLVISSLLNSEYSTRTTAYRATEDYLISFLFDGIKA